MLQSYTKSVTLRPPLPRNPPALTLARLPLDETGVTAQVVRNERRTWLAALLVAVASAVQVAAGLAFGSVALVANGAHSGAHVAALAVAGAAYRVARANAHNPRLAHGAGRIGDLAAFANAVLLALAAFGLAVESVSRLVTPEVPDYPAALYAAAGGLALNLACMALLRPGAADRRDPSGDINLSAAHLHVAADAAVAALTLAGLFAAWRLGWTWADPVAALVGAGLIAHFAATILRRAGAALLDLRQSPALEAEVALRLEAAGLVAEDVRAWRTGAGRNAVAVRLRAPSHEAPAQVRRALEGLSGVSRISLDLT
ncbi:cation transporter [Phenylobacterium parvum]|uniref:Cation transporter n=1 Tax=Phenylobacterium parvum TaxID=2201350 RepID=A0A2Z3HT13_9CAUL|nr:cation transporter [Phenylobacterium parvum]